MPNTTRTQIPAEVNNFYDRTLLMRALPQFIHTKWAQTRNIPRKAGTNVIKFRRYGNLTAATTPLTEGVTPAGSQLSVTDVTATVAQYGDYVTVTDVLDYESQDPVLMEAAEILGDQAADTLDQLTRDVLNAGTSVSFGGSGNTATADVAAGDVLTTTLLDAALLTLKNNNTRKVSQQVDATTGIGTTPIKAAYIGIVHTSLGAKVKALTGFVSVEKYPSQTDVMEGEIGYYNEIRFVESTNGKVFTGAGTGGIDVYTVVLMGMHAYGTTAINGEALKNIVKPLGSAGTADPLDQRATSGWKATFVAKILNNNFITRIEVALT